MAPALPETDAARIVRLTAARWSASRIAAACGVPGFGDRAARRAVDLVATCDAHGIDLTVNAALLGGHDLQLAMFTLAERKGVRASSKPSAYDGPPAPDSRGRRTTRRTPAL